MGTRRNRVGRYVGLTTVSAGFWVGGCQAGPSVTTTPPLNRASASPAATTAPAADDGHWQATAAPAGPTSPEALAAATARYSKVAMSTVSPADPAAVPPADDGAVRFDQPTARRSDPPVVPAPVAQLAADVQTPPRVPPARDQPELISVDTPPPRPTAVRPSVEAAEPLSRRIGDRVRSDPQDLAAELDLALYGLLNDDAGAELPSAAALQPEDREVLAALLDGLANFRATVRRDPAALPAVKVKPFLDMDDRIRQQADLAVTAPVLCRRVDTFGKYDPFPSAQFAAGRDNLVIVDCEVDNFRSTLSAKQLWETRFAQQLTLLTPAGVVAWTERPPEMFEASRSRRRDMYLFARVKLPSSLPAGRYSLKVSTEDEIAHRAAESTTALSLVGSGAVATVGR